MDDLHLPWRVESSESKSWIIDASHRRFCTEVHTLKRKKRMDAIVEAVNNYWGFYPLRREAEVRDQLRQRIEELEECAKTWCHKAEVAEVERDKLQTELHNYSDKINMLCEERDRLRTALEVLLDNILINDIDELYGVEIEQGRRIIKEVLEGDDDEAEALPDSSRPDRGRDVLRRITDPVDGDSGPAPLTLERMDYKTIGVTNNIKLWDRNAEAIEAWARSVEARLK